MVHLQLLSKGHSADLCANDFNPSHSIRLVYNLGHPSLCSDFGEGRPPYSAKNVGRRKWEEVIVKIEGKGGKDGRRGGEECEDSG